MRLWRPLAHLALVLPVRSRWLASVAELAMDGSLAAGEIVLDGVAGVSTGLDWAAARLTRAAGGRGVSLEPWVSLDLPSGRRTVRSVSLWSGEGG